jgi:hypothetical protein
MNPALSGAHPLRYFIHDDFDAFRIELSGSLVGLAAQKAYETWRSASLLGRRGRLVVDITYVTEADEHGKAVLRAWRELKARIVASSLASRAIADSVLDAPVPLPSARWTLVGPLGSFFRRLAAGNPAGAESAGIPSADAKQPDVENTGFPLIRELEQQLR